MISAILVLLAITLYVSHAAYCSGSPKPGNYTSSYDIFVNKNARLIKEVKNGKLYMYGPPNAEFPVVHVWGTPYEMGYAQGELLPTYTKEFVFKTFDYLVKMVVDDSNSELFSPFVKSLIVDYGMNRALDWCARVTAPFTPKSYNDELQGIADAAGIDYEMLVRVNMFPEITKASCSFFGAWDTATANGKTFQLRALDYDTDGPFKDYNQLTVYHHDGDDSTDNSFINVAWPGLIGSLTGMNAGQMAISEIGVSFPDDSFGQGTDDTPPEKVHGKPWMYVLRDVLEKTHSLEEAVSSIQTANRTCNLIIGVGDGEEGMVNGIQYSGYVANAYADTNLLPQNDTWHPQITDVVYNGMDWLCPSFTDVLGEQLQIYHGQLEENVITKNILPTVQTGNLHIAVYDLTDENMYVSFARPSSASTDEPFYAYQRQFTKLDLKNIFGVSRPQL